MLPRLLCLIGRYALRPPYSWQQEQHVHLHVPGNIRSVARQALRCALHRLASNGVFQQLFTGCFADAQLFRAIAASLGEFTEMNAIAPLVMLFQELSDRKQLPQMTQLLHTLSNVALYVECAFAESSVPTAGWAPLFPFLDTFLRRFSLALHANRVYDLSSVLRIMLVTLKLPALATCKSLLDCYSKLLSQAIQQSPLQYERLLQLCSSCARLFAKERDRFLLTRTAVYELVSFVKLKSVLPDENVLLLLQFVLQDANGTLVPSLTTHSLRANFELSGYATGALDCVRQHVHELLDFLADVHSLNRIKQMFLGNVNVNISCFCFLSKLFVFNSLFKVHVRKALMKIN